MKHRASQYPQSLCSASSIAKAGQRNGLSRFVVPRLHTGLPPTPGALKYCIERTEDVRQVVGVALQLASSPPPSRTDRPHMQPDWSAASVRDASVASPRIPRPYASIGLSESSNRLSEAPSTAESSSSRSSLSSLFDDIQTELRDQSAALPPSPAQCEPSSDPPKACRSPPQVLPRSVRAQPVTAAAALPPLPRTITKRPKLAPNFSTHIHPVDDWLLRPQAPSVVAARLRAEPPPSATAASSIPLASTEPPPEDPWYHPDIIPGLSALSETVAAPSPPSATAEAHYLPQAEVPWTPGRLVTLLRALSAAGMHAAACELLAFLFDTQARLFTELDLSRPAVLGLLWEWSKDPEGAHSAVMLVSGALRHTPQPPCVLRAALTAAAATGALSSTQQLFDALRQVPGELDGQSYGLLIAAYGKAGQWRAAADLFQQMRANRVEPTVKTYTTLIKACTAAGAPERAVSFFAQMEAEGVHADLLAYNSLMGVFSRVGDWGRAWSVLGAMRRAGVDPDIVSYNTLLKACERAGEWPRVVEVYSRLERECADSGRLRPNVITFNTLISAAGKAGEWEKSLELYADMDDYSVLPDKVTMSSLVNALESGGQWELAIEKFEELRRGGVDPNAICYNAAISALAKGSQAAAAKAVVVEMCKDGYEPDIYTYGPLVGALGRAGLVDEAFQVWEDMKAAGVQGNTYVYVALINACEQSSDWKRALQVFYAMKEADVEINSLSVAARQILYHWPQVLDKLPPPIVAAARAAVDSGRAARSRVHDALKDIPTEL